MENMVDRCEDVSCKQQRVMNTVLFTTEELPYAFTAFFRNHERREETHC